MTAILTVLDSNKNPKGRKIALIPPEQTIGRGTAAKILLVAATDGYIITQEGDDRNKESISMLSRVHAKFTCVDGVWMLSDSGSTNGTFLNLVKVEKDPKPIQDGDIIELSHHVGLLFTASKHEEDAPTVVGKDIVVAK